MLTILALMLSATADAGTSLTVPAGGSGWNGFQVLGLTPSTVAVRELTLADEEGSGEACENPGMAAVVKGRAPSELPGLGGPPTIGVTLHAWSLPPAGQVSLARGPHGVVYRSGGELGHCTTAAEATAALTAMKSTFADAGVDIAKPPPHVELFSGLKEADFTGDCFVYGTHRAGCTMKRTVALDGQSVTLNITQRASSDCVKQAGDDASLGCQVDRTYVGTVEYRGAQVPFSLHAPAHGDNATFWLESGAAWTSGPTSVVVLNFAWCLMSCRERTPVLIRVR